MSRPTRGAEFGIGMSAAAITAGVADVIVTGSGVRGFWPVRGVLVEDVLDLGRIELDVVSNPALTSAVVPVRRPILGSTMPRCGCDRGGLTPRKDYATPVRPFAIGVVPQCRIYRKNNKLRISKHFSFRVDENETIK